VSQQIDVSIISSGANLADARLHRLTRALLRAGLSVEIFAPGRLHDAPTVTSDSGQLYIRKPWLSESWGKGNLLARYHRSRLFTFRARGKVLYAVSPEAVAPALGFARLRGKKFAVDFFEDYLRLLNDRAWAKKYFGILGAIARSDTKSALWFAKRADLTTVADIQVPPFEARNRLVVRNLPDSSMLTESGARGDIPRAIYIGDLRKSRGLHAMLRVAELTPGWEFDLVGGVAAADQEFVERWLATNSARERVRFHGRLAPTQSWKIAAGAWVGLSLLENTPAFSEAVPSKLYEYMRVGLPSISSPLPRCVELIHLSKAGAIESSPEGVSERLKYWGENLKELDAIKIQAARWARENLDSEREYANFASEMVKLTR
jgi:glycosyltransferase involved in cell wall biosynthesis